MTSKEFADMAAKSLTQQLEAAGQTNIRWVLVVGEQSNPQLELRRNMSILQTLGTMGACVAGDASMLLQEEVLAQQRATTDTDEINNRQPKH